MSDFTEVEQESFMEEMRRVNKITQRRVNKQMEDLAYYIRHRDSLMVINDCTEYIRTQHRIIDDLIEYIAGLPLPPRKDIP